LIVPQNEELETVTESNTDDSMLSLLEVSTPKTNSLTTAQKHSLVQIKSQELGINLSLNEISKISEMVSDQISDSINFLNEVGILISEFFTNRNNQVQSIVEQKINDISNIINTKNEQLGDIFSSANQRLNDIAGECNREKTDYKSTYQSKLESIREILKLSA
jgi:Na+/phosphate symporter